MLLLRAMPNVADTPENAGFRRWFYSKWGKENCIISAWSRQASYPLFQQRLSIKAAWHGSESYHLDGRTVAVDDDNYLVINDQREYGSTIAASRPVHSFAIFFRPGMAEETLGGLWQAADQALARDGEPARRAIEFPEMLRPHDTLVTPALRFIAHHIDQGLEDELWYEEQLSFLLERLLRAHRRLLRNTAKLAVSRGATRREIVRRIGWSTDHINTWFERQLSNDELARAARLSPFHFIRLFRSVHGVTPYRYVQRKRTSVALRLLASTDWSHEEIALKAGFDHRSTMFRHLVRWTGSGGRTHRRRARSNGEDGTGIQTAGARDELVAGDAPCSGTDVTHMNGTRRRSAR